MLLSIDPGSETSGWTLMKGTSVASGGSDILNLSLVYGIRIGNFGPVCCEWMESSRGMPVGAETFDTVRWIGRFEQAAAAARRSFFLVPRRHVKLHLCNSMRATDANIRRAILDLYPATGGGSVKQIGTKAKPGPLYGVKGHMWQAIAVGLTHQFFKDDA